MKLKIFAAANIPEKVQKVLSNMNWLLIRVLSNRRKKFFVLPKFTKLIRQLFFRHTLDAPSILKFWSLKILMLRLAILNLKKISVTSWNIITFWCGILKVTAKKMPVLPWCLMKQKNFIIIFLRAELTKIHLFCRRIHFGNFAEARINFSPFGM